MSTLSQELRARARWAGLYTARRILRGGGTWLKAALDPNGQQPPTVRVDLARRLEPACVQAFAEEMIAGTLVQRLASPAIDGRLWVVDDAAWWVWEANTLHLAQTGIGELRSEGAIIFVLGKHAGQTLDAVGETLDASLPATIESMLDRSVVQDADKRELAEAAKHLSWAWDALGANPSWLLVPCLDASPSWWNVPPSIAWWSLIEALWPKANRPGTPKRPLKLTRSAIRSALTGASPATGSGSSKASSAPTVASWLTAIGEDGDLLHDSGLETIFTNDHWAKDSATRNALLRARVAAVKMARASLKDAKETDFAKLAPLPALGPKRESANIAPGVPVLDAVWILRELLAAFPGQIVGVGALLGPDEHPYLTVTQVTLRLKRGLVPGAPECVIFPPEAAGSRALRAFGCEMVQYSRKANLKPTEGVYEVAVRCVVTDAASPNTPIDVVAEFPWRWAKVPSTTKAREDAVRGDRERFATVRHELDGLVKGALHAPSHAGAALASLAALDTCWKALGAQCDVAGVAEHGGLHVARGVLWTPVKEFLDAYQLAATALIELFAGAGNLASRIADGPLEQFLRFGTVDDGAGPDARRIFGYHPLRLARLADVEGQAFLEAEESLRGVSTLRDVPLVALPPLDGVPTVLWAAPGRGVPAGTLKPFLVPTEATTRHDTDPWSERYVRFADSGDTERDLVEPLRPVLTMLAALFPGMARRASVRLDEASRTNRGVRPLLLLADAVKDGGPSRPQIAWGVDLHACDGVVTAHINEASDDPIEPERLATITEAMTEARADDPHFPLEIHADDGTARKHHLALLVRPSLPQSTWATRAMPGTAAEAAAMVWEPDALAWSQVKVPGLPGDGLGATLRSARYEQLFQRLVVLRWRREADAMARCLGLSLEASPEHPDGAALLESVGRCAERAARVVVVDRVYGAEAIDAIVPSGGELRVKYADFHRDEGWRVTVIAHKGKAPDREREAVRRGLARLYGCQESIVDHLSSVVYNATHRSVPAVFRALCRAGSDRQTEVDAELVGHLGAAVLMSTDRASCVLEKGATWPAGWESWAKPQIEGTLLLSMDSLQRWTWTRRSGTRGDFIALLPETTGGVKIVAVESKGSEGSSAADGTSQAAVAASKLRERFAAPERWQERSELLVRDAQSPWQ